MKKTGIILTAILAVAFIAGTVLAYGPESGKGKKGSGSGCRQQGFHAGFSKLSEDQQEQLTTLRQKFIDDTYEFRSAQMETQGQIRLLMETSSPDRAKLETLFGEMDGIRKQIREKFIDFRLEAKKIAPELAFGKGGRDGRGCIKGKGKMGGSGGGCFF